MAEVRHFKHSDFTEPDWNHNYLGEGTFGIVFRLKEKRTGKYYAVKFIKSVGPDDPSGQTALSVFNQEIRMLASLNHPSLVRLYGKIDDDPQAMITEFIPNNNINSYISPKIETEGS